MIYMSIDDFYEKVSSFPPMNRQEETECALQMKNGDTDARERMVQCYLPMIAGRMRRLSPHLQTLGMALYCQQALEKAVDSFNFFQDRESFSHHLSRYLRQAVTAYIADH